MSDQRDPVRHGGHPMNARKGWQVRWARRIGIGALVKIFVLVAGGASYEAIARHRAARGYPCPRSAIRYDHDDQIGRSQHAGVAVLEGPWMPAESEIVDGGSVGRRGSGRRA